MDLQLRKFDPSKIKDDAVCVFVGRRGSGKTVILSQIMAYKRHIPGGIVMSGTEDGNGYFSNYVPDSYVYSDYHPDVIENVLDRQRMMVKKKLPNAGMFIVLDDLGYDQKTMREKSLRSLFMNGRHFKIFLMMTFQYVRDMSPAIRTNIDYIFILKDNSKENAEKLYQAFGGIFPNYDSFRHTMECCTENYECMVIDNTSHSRKKEECVFWYKAKVYDKPFKMGSAAFWALHKKKYDKHHDDKSRKNPEGQKKGPSIKIHKLK